MANEELKNKPVLAPKAAAASSASPAGDSDEVATLRAQVDRLEAILMATIQSQPKVTPDSIWAQQHQKEAKIREELESLAAKFQNSCEQRTQWDANKLNLDAKKLFKIKVGWCPEVVVRANDEIMARAYYDKVCNITTVTPNHAKPATTTYSIVDVTNDPAAQAVVNSNWEHKAAA